MKQMLQYLKAYKKESIIAPLFKMLESRMVTSRISGECAR